MCMNLYRYIDREKVQFDFIKHSYEKGIFEDEILSLGGRIFSAPRYKIYNHLSYSRWWKRFLRQHPEYKIIHGHFFTISSVFFAVAKKEGRVTIGHIHSTKVPRGGTKRPVVNFLANRMVERISHFSDYCIACSTAAGEWVYGKRHFIVLKNGLDCNEFRFSQDVRKEMRKTIGLHDEFTIGTVANMSTAKNPMGLIDIFLSIKKENPIAKLVWVGEGDLRPTIETRIKQDGINNSVVLLGSRNDVPRVLQAIDAFLLPSFYEGLPVSAIEAQASGLPCFVSDRVTKEVDITGLCHFLPINQPTLWAQEILREEKPRKDQSAKIIDAGYDIHTTAKWLEEFYLSLEK